MTTDTTVEAGKLSPWGIDELPEPPRSGRKLWIALIGPGVVLAGMSIGTGEWLFGPAVSAQYGACLFWLASISIALQGFCNLMFMRYAIYCGEPMNVGILRTWPGPIAWILLFLVLEFPAIWPYNASNAAIPLAAAILGRLPKVPDDELLVKSLGISIFLLAFVPLIFGGTVYRMLEKIMMTKLVVVLGYLSVIALTMVSLPVVWDVATGFVRFGTVPIRPEVLIVGRNFHVRQVDGDTTYVVKGTWERKDNSVTGEMIVTRQGKPEKFNLADTGKLDANAARIQQEVLDRSRNYFDDSRRSQGTTKDRFLIEAGDGGETLIAEGNVIDYHIFTPTRLQVRSSDAVRTFSSLPEIPEPQRSRMKNHLQHEGLAYVNLYAYVREHGRLPALDWAFIVAFVAIAGAGGLTNSMFSNYARDKGWGMGCHVGAIPSVFGGVTVGLSHSGKIFPLNDENLSRWRGWLVHIGRDQAIWIVASVIGMALPCMMSLEFIRNTSVVGDRVAAMAAEGITVRYPSFASVLWFLTLFCGFLVLAPGQVGVGDQVARRWTDMIWNSIPRVKRLGEVRYVYYGILVALAAFGLVILVVFPAVQTATISAVLQNIALGTAALMSLYVNRKLLPRELQPGWFHQLGVVLCGLFFLGISVALLILWFGLFK